MAEMEREKKETEHVEHRHKIVLETVNHHRVDIVMAERVRLEQGKPWISYTHGEVRQMVNNKREHDQSAHDHVSRGERGFYIVPVEVWFRAGTPVFNRLLDG